jgi:outer membrane immunogenic protein
MPRSVACLPRFYRSVCGLGAITLAAGVAPTVAQDRFTGPYIGLHAGFGFPAKLDDVGIRDATLNSFIDTYGNLGPKGVLGGFGVGYSTRIGGLLAGFDLDASLGKISDAAAATKSGLTVASRGDTASLATLRGRIGVPLTPSTQIFATAGLAAANYNYEIAYSGVLNGTLTRNASTFGWSAGAGAEWAIDAKWSFKAEYLYLALMKARTITDDTISTIEHLQQAQVRAGLNYKF